VFPLLLVTVCLAFSILTGLDHPVRGDEGHFIETVGIFAEEPGPSTWTDYPEVTGPFFYWVYSLWGRLAGTGPAGLRVLSLITGISALLLIYRLYRSELKAPGPVMAGMALLLVNPYFAGLCLHVFTDMLALLLVVIAVTALRERRGLMLLVSVTLALLTRQYAIFMVAAAGVFLIVTLKGSGGRNRGLIAALLAGIIPLAVMMVLWRGPAPPAGIERWIIDDGPVYRIRYIYIYTAFIALYSLPLVIFAWRRLLSIRSAAAGLALSSGALLFPLGASEVTLAQTDTKTVGLAHGLLTRVLGTGLMMDAVFWLLCLLGFMTLTALVDIDLGSKGRTGGFPMFLSLMVLAFLVIMPFSYQVWEKYLIMVMPFFVLRLLMLVRKDDLAPGQG